MTSLMPNPDEGAGQQQSASQQSYPGRRGRRLTRADMGVKIQKNESRVFERPANRDLPAREHPPVSYNEATWGSAWGTPFLNIQCAKFRGEDCPNPRTLLEIDHQLREGAETRIRVEVANRLRTRDVGQG